MLKERTLLETILLQKFDKIIFDSDICREIFNYVNQKYDIPKGLVSDLIYKRVPLGSTSEFILFVLVDAVNQFYSINRPIQIGTYYTAQEIIYYSKQKYQVDSIKFPLNFKVIQITDDQWSGRISIKELMKLRKAQLIIYNENAQRTMQKIVKGGKETYAIHVNNRAVKKIKESYERNSFIPNTITLNIPLESDCDFYYDVEKCNLVIKKLEHFDITDGYHRYLAASRISNMNEDFDYPMELRITNFSEEKSQQFIYQEDQKTKMKKIDSDSYNKNNPANNVVSRLNESSRCNIQGMISRNEGLISFGELAEVVHYFYFKGTNKSQEKELLINTVKNLTENFNVLTEANTSYLNKKFNFQMLMAIVFCFEYFKNDKNKDKMIDAINQLINRIESGEIITKEKKVRKSSLIKLEKILKGES